MTKLRTVIVLLITIISLAANGRRYTVLVSLDGFRWNYPEIYNTPFLDTLGHRGVTAVMRPSFPSVTFPNHYTLATGLVPDHHGIIANKFRDRESGLVFSLGDKQTKQDPRFWGGEPIWNTATRQGVKVGLVYWPGSDVKIQGRYPTYYKDYEQKPLLTFAERIAEVRRLLSLPEQERPQLVMAYFEEPDHSGHVYGPESKHTRRTVESMDVLMEQLYENIESLPQHDSINIIITSDHGMTALSPERLVNPYDYIKKEWVESIDYGLPSFIFPKKGCEAKIMKALAAAPHIRVWKKADVPAYLQYGENENVGDIVVLPDVGWTFGDRKPHLGGTHGFDPYDNDMQVMFRALGPDFKRGYVKKTTFQNTAVYPLLCHLLGIAPAKVDGQLSDVDDILAR